MTPHRQLTTTNRVLAGLPLQNRGEFIASCDHVQLRFADVLYRHGETIEHVYFPVGCSSG